MCGIFRWLRIGRIGMFGSVPSVPTTANTLSCRMSWFVSCTVFAGL